jgi:hypothetical protein
MKGLIIDEPWITKILSGSKTWVMRKTACHQTGTIALIRKGCGQIVGTAEIDGSMPPLANGAAYAAAEPRHGIPPDRQVRAFQDGWRTPWVLTNARSLAKPVSYDHPSGAVIWVNLADHVAAAIRAQLGVDAVQPIALAEREDLTSVTAPRPNPRAKRPEPEVTEDEAPSVPVSDGSVRLITVTQANIDYSHIYLPLDMFPADAIGGNNKTLLADRNLTIRFRPGQVVSTDIDRSKRILRNRGATRDFLERTGLKAGDQVRLIRTSPYSYDIASAARGV